ncbi:MAG TPA: hypothetical protein PKD48_01855 [Sphingopyxis sp.]|nr:hypothetical protein [Sphingopyxis sp.]
MTPLERAARAAIEETGAYAIATVEGEPAAWMAEGGVRSEEHFRDIARAVLEAVREPTHGMIIGGEEVSNKKTACEDIWIAMIDAALKEG